MSASGPPDSCTAAKSRRFDGSSGQSASSKATSPLCGNGWRTIGHRDDFGSFRRVTNADALRTQPTLQRRIEAPARFDACVEDCISRPFCCRSDVGKPVLLVARAKYANAIVTDAIAKQINTNPYLTGFHYRHSATCFVGAEIEQPPLLSGSRANLTSVAPRVSASLSLWAGAEQNTTEPPSDTAPSGLICSCAVAISSSTSASMSSS
jgi:hypothetical protein